MRKFYFLFLSQWEYFTFCVWVSENIYFLCLSQREYFTYCAWVKENILPTVPDSESNEDVFRTTDSVLLMRITADGWFSFTYENVLLSIFESDEDVLRSVFDSNEDVLRSIFKSNKDVLLQPIFESNKDILLSSILESNENILHTILRLMRMFYYLAFDKRENVLRH